MWWRYLTLGLLGFVPRLELSLEKDGKIHLEKLKTSAHIWTRTAVYLLIYTAVPGEDPFNVAVAGLEVGTGLRSRGASIQWFPDAFDLTAHIHHDFGIVLGTWVRNSAVLVLSLCRSLDPGKLERADAKHRNRVCAHM